MYYAELRLYRHICSQGCAFVHGVALSNEILLVRIFRHGQAQSQRLYRCGDSVSDELINASDLCIRIDMCGKVESLNAAVAAGIAMYMFKAD